MTRTHPNLRGLGAETGTAESVIGSVADALTQVGPVAGNVTSQVMLSRKQAEAIEQQARAARFGAEQQALALGRYLWPAVAAALGIGGIALLVWMAKKKKRRSS